MKTWEICVRFFAILGKGRRVLGGDGLMLKFGLGWVYENGMVSRDDLAKLNCSLRLKN